MIRNAATIAIMLSLGGCSTLSRLTACDTCDQAPTWSERTTGEKWAIVGFGIVGLAALYALVANELDDGDELCVGDCGPPNSDPNVPCMPAGGVQIPGLPECPRR